MPTKERPSKLGLQRRFVDVKREAINEEARTINVAFSSEHPVERWWGYEILDHSPDSVRLGRLQGGGAVLVDHRSTDHVGVVESVQIDGDRTGRATLRFGKSQRAQEIWQDVVDGIRRHISVGYAIHRMTLEEQGKDMPDKYRITDWEPHEISLVAVPADPTVGVGRAEEREFDVEIISSLIEDRSMPEVTTPAPSVDVQAVTNAARETEITRAREILAAGHLHNREEMAQKAVADGTPLEQFRAELLVELAKGKKPVPSAEIGLTDREAREFSIVRLINAATAQALGKHQDAAQLGGFELEASAAARQKFATQRGTVTIPYDVLLRGTRDLTTSIASGTSKAGYTVATDLLAGSFIDALRNRMVLPTLGAQFLPGLVGNIAIPKLTTATTVYWVAENAAPTEGAPVFGQVTMSPKTVAAFVDFSRRLTLQSTPAVEGLVRDDLTKGLAVAIDEAGIGTSGTNRPTGVRGTSGIGSVAIGTNGGAPTWASVVNLVREVDVDNALTGSAAFLTNAKVKAKMATTPTNSSGVEGNFILREPWTSVYGYPFVVSNQVPSTLTKGTASGVCSAMFFGVWSNLIIGQWSGIDLLVDPYTGSSAGTVRVTAFADVDVAVRYAEAFAAVLDYTTT